MPHEGYADPIMDDGPRFHSNIAISELTEHVTRAIEASDVSSTPLVIGTVDGAMITRQDNPRLEPCYAWGLEAASHQTKPGEKTQMSPIGPCPTCSKADSVILTFLFNPNLEPYQ